MGKPTTDITHLCALIERQAEAITYLAENIARLAESNQMLIAAMAGDDEDEDGEECGYYLDGTPK